MRSQENLAEVVRSQEVLAFAEDEPVVKRLFWILQPGDNPMVRVTLNAQNIARVGKKRGERREKV